MLERRPHAVPYRFGGRSSVRQELFGCRTEIVVCWSSKRYQIGFSPLCGCSGVIAGQSGTSLGRRNKNGVVRACLLYSSAPTFPDGEIQC